MPTEIEPDPPAPPTPTAPRPRRRRFRRLAAIALGAVLGVVLGAGWLGQSLLLRPVPRRPVSRTPDQSGMPDYRPVTLHPDRERGADFALNAWYIPGARRETVVLCHGRGDSRVGMLPVAEILHELGYTVFVLEFRAHGDSGGTWSTVGAAEQRDLVAALDWLDANGANPVAAFGYSMGGCVALCVAAKDDRILGVATEGAVTDLPAFARYHYGPLATPILTAAAPWIWLRTGSSLREARPIAVVQRIAPRPVLLIYSRADRVVPLSFGERLYEAAAEPKELWILDDARHVGGVVRYAREYRARLASFYAGVFGPAEGGTASARGR